jgi:hypothetical protein
VVAIGFLKIKDGSEGRKGRERTFLYFTSNLGTEVETDSGPGSPSLFFSFLLLPWFTFFPHISPPQSFSRPFSAQYRNR